MSKPPMTSEELAAALRAMANRWTLKARDHARESKIRSAESDMHTSYYHRGVAETWHRAALELAALLKADGEPEPSAPPAAERTAAPTAPAEPQVMFANVSLTEAVNLLEFAGVSARDVNKHADNAFTAIFSRWQPFSEAERLEKIKQADMRVVILNYGKLRDTGDPYVDFAFKA